MATTMHCVRTWNAFKGFKKCTEIEIEPTTAPVTSMVLLVLLCIAAAGAAVAWTKSKRAKAVQQAAKAAALTFNETTPSFKTVMDEVKFKIEEVKAKFVPPVSARPEYSG